MQRHAVRQNRGIAGEGYFEDICNLCFCMPCAIVQMETEMNTNGRRKEKPKEDVKLAPAT